jgi:hypothetical protein
MLQQLSIHFGTSLELEANHPPEKLGLAHPSEAG